MKGTLPKPTLLALDEYDVNHREWKDMPEYNNVKPPEPLITVTIKFETEKDYDSFHKLLKKLRLNYIIYLQQVKQIKILKSFLCL